MTVIMHIITLTYLYGSFGMADTRSSFLVVPPVKSNTCCSLVPLFLTGCLYFFVSQKAGSSWERCQGLGLDYTNWEVRWFQASTNRNWQRSLYHWRPVILELAWQGLGRKMESYFWYKLILTYCHLFRVKARLSQTLRELRGLQFLSYINHLASPPPSTQLVFYQLNLFPRPLWALGELRLWGACFCSTSLLCGLRDSVCLQGPNEGGVTLNQIAHRNLLCRGPLWVTKKPQNTKTIQETYNEKGLTAGRLDYI